MTATIQIDDRLFLQARELAQAVGMSVEVFIAQTVEASLKSQKPAAELHLAYRPQAL